MRARVWWCALALQAASTAAYAKNHGYSSPRSREIYRDDETFAEVSDTGSRWFIVEVVTGVAPQGNLALLLGIINQPLHGLEFYAGYGTEANPARTYNADLRYMFSIEGYRPFIGVGFSHRQLYQLGLRSENLFAEAGYKWVFRPTYHITLAAGVRRVLHFDLEDDSKLTAPDTDPALLDAHLGQAKQWVPTLALKFSRAF